MLCNTKHIFIVITVEVNFSRFIYDLFISLLRSFNDATGAQHLMEMHENVFQNYFFSKCVQYITKDHP